MYVYGNEMWLVMLLPSDAEIKKKSFISIMIKTIKIIGTTNLLVDHSAATGYIYFVCILVVKRHLQFTRMEIIKL